MHSFDLYIHVYLIFLSNHKYLFRLSLFSLKINQTMNSSEALRMIDCGFDLPLISKRNFTGPHVLEV